MKGEPIKQAMAAARAFAAKRTPHAELGVDHVQQATTKIGAAASTSDRRRSQRALARHARRSPTARASTTPSTAAVDLLETSGIDVRLDRAALRRQTTSARTTREDDARRGRRRATRVRIFSVGLESPRSHPRTSPASPGEPAGRSRSPQTADRPRARSSPRSASRSRNEYLISYRSLAGPGAEGLRRRSRCRASPAPPSPPTRRPAFRSAPSSPAVVVGPVHPVARSPRSLVIALVVLLCRLVASTSSSRRRDRRFERRLARFVSLSPEEQARLRRADVAETLEQDRPSASRFQPSRLVHARSQEDVELGRLDMPPPVDRRR